MKSLTIFDIARLAGVGKSTVSRVLNNDTRVSPKTREKVTAVIEKYGYSPSSSAQRMAAGKSKTIGIIASRLDSPSENRAIRGMLEVIYSQGYDVILLESSFSPENVRLHVQQLIRKQVEGAIIFTLADSEYTYLDSAAFPVVMIGQAVPGYTSVIYDDMGAVCKVMDYVVHSRGAKKVAFIGVEESDPTTGRARFQAYQNYCQDNGLANRYWLGDLSYHSGYVLAKQALQTEPDCIVCAADTLAIGARKLLIEQGRDDILLTGIGNNELLRFQCPEHISVRLSYKQSGYQAIQHLQHLMSQKSNEQVSSDEIIIMPCELIT